MPTDPSDDSSPFQSTDLGSTPVRPPETVTTYQQSLDEALEETFPASDPISPSALQALEARVSTAADSVDWALRSHKPAAGLPPSWAAVLGAFGLVLISGRGSRFGLLVRAGVGALLGVAGAQAWERRRKG
jgi:hypothetical protein